MYHLQPIINQVILSSFSECVNSLKIKIRRKRTPYVNILETHLSFKKTRFSFIILLFIFLFTVATFVYREIIIFNIFILFFRWKICIWLSSARERIVFMSFQKFIKSVFFVIAKSSHSLSTYILVDWAESTDTPKKN